MIDLDTHTTVEGGGRCGAILTLTAECRARSGEGTRDHLSPSHLSPLVGRLRCTKWRKGKCSEEKGMDKGGKQDTEGKDNMTR